MALLMTGCLPHGAVEGKAAGPALPLEAETVGEFQVPEEGFDERFKREWATAGKLVFQDLTFRNRNAAEVTVSVGWDQAPSLWIVQEIRSVELEFSPNLPHSEESFYSRAQLAAVGRVAIQPAEGLRAEARDLPLDSNGRMEFRIPPGAKAAFSIVFFRPGSLPMKRIQDACFQRKRGDPHLWTQFFRGWKGWTELSRTVCWSADGAREACLEDGDGGSRARPARRRFSRRFEAQIGQTDLIPDEKFFDELPPFVLGSDTLWIPYPVSNMSAAGRCEDGVEEIGDGDPA